MNGARSTFMRKGYWLTALAAIVLLAASPGTAYAQSIGFSGSSATMMEGAAPGMGTPDPITITITVSGLTLEGDDLDREDGLGIITLMHDADKVYPGQIERLAEQRRIWVDGSSSAVDEARLDDEDEHSVARGKYGVTGGEIPYDNNGVITLVIIDPGGDTNWVDNKFTMRIESSELGISPNPGSYSVTVTDDDVQPTAKFSKTNLALTEETQTTMAVPVAITVGVPAATKAANTPALADLDNNIRFTASPKGAAVTSCDPTSEKDVIAVTMRGIDPYTMGGATDTWEVKDNVGATNGTPATISVIACKDGSGFNDEMVTFSFVGMSLMGTPAGWGNIANGGDLVVTVLSVGEDKPEVTFSTTSLSIAEGDTSTVAIIADGKLGPEVGSVMVSVSGDAVLSLRQGTDMLEADADGMYAVDLGISANTILTVMADDDPALDDDMTATATLTIESASGADIGARDSLAVTVSGVTQETDPEAVPALPLIAQWLLGLGLMGGGARQLFRRRRQG